MAAIIAWLETLNLWLKSIGDWIFSLPEKIKDFASYIIFMMGKVFDYLYLQIVSPIIDYLSGVDLPCSTCKQIIIDGISSLHSGSLFEYSGLFFTF